MQLLDAEFFDFSTVHKFTIDISTLIAKTNKCINHRPNIALLNFKANIHCTLYYNRLQNKYRGEKLTITSANSI